MSAAAGRGDSLSETVISLIGYRGSGKTCVGRRLAERLGWEFVDTDETIQQEAGRTIREIFDADGERAFRKLEADVLEQALAGHRRVISAGGGAVLARRNRRALRSAGPCIWLTAPAEELARRIEADERSSTQRPSLTGQSGLAEIEMMLQARLPVYEATADHVVSTADRTPDQVVETILRQLGVAAPLGENV
jgi:shikimate kinase